eukprot:1005757-Pyramimonas_sp.AAC.1
MKSAVGEVIVITCHLARDAIGVAEESVDVLLVSCDLEIANVLRQPEHQLCDVSTTSAGQL